MAVVSRRRTKGTAILVIDAIVNLALGFLLLLSVPFPAQVTTFLGVPDIAHPFYPSLFGGVLVGIGIALLIECLRRGRQGLTGLGLGGAVAINLSGGAVLVAWLILGDLAIPVRGRVFLWAIAALLVGVSAVELIAYARKAP